MSKPKCLVFVALMCMFASSSVVAAFARTPAGEAMAAPAPRPTPLAYPQLEADFSIYNWHKSETPRDLIGTMTVYPSGGDGHYTYEFIGVRYTNTFDFRWRACTTLVNSLRV